MNGETEIAADAQTTLDAALSLLAQGGPIVWIIAGLSVLTAAIGIWKAAHFASLGAFGGGRAETAAQLWRDGRRAEALAAVEGGRRAVSSVAAAAMRSLAAQAPEEKAREEAERVARDALGELRVGLRGLEVIATIAPLLGLLGTVLGMIEAFQALQSSGAQADPAALAGGIWEALLTTAAGMAVAIPASVLLSWSESVADRTRRRMESAAGLIFAAPGAQRDDWRGAAAPLYAAAE